ncbi:LysE/ArgO family amino acid transporter [Actinomycetes bacterium NPDC127524]
MLAAAIHSFILSFGLILPLGVQNIFVFNQGAIQPRFSKALPAIFTAAICDTLLISMSILGVSVMVFEYTPIKLALYSGGIFFLIFMGFVTWKSKSKQADSVPDVKFSAKKQITFALSVSLLNPHALLDTAGVIGTSSLHYDGASKLVFGFTSILVSWLWFSGLGIAGRLTGKMDPSGNFLNLLNKASALVMWTTAIYLCILLLKQL